MDYGKWKDKVVVFILFSSLFFFLRFAFSELVTAFFFSFVLK